MKTTVKMQQVLQRVHEPVADVVGEQVGVVVEADESLGLRSASCLSCRERLMVQPIRP